MALATLGFERSTAALSQTIRFQKEFEHFVNHLAKTEVEGRPLSEDPAVRQEAMRLYAGLRVMRMNNLRLITELLASGGAPGPQSSLSKLYWSEWHRDFGEAATRLLGPYGMLYRDRDFHEGDALQEPMLMSRAETVYAGTSQIQRNIIGEMVLGLPKEPKPRDAE